jgi:hypothetical protein
MDAAADTTTELTGESEHDGDNDDDDESITKYTVIQINSVYTLMTIIYKKYEAMPRFFLLEGGKKK